MAQINIIRLFLELPLLYLRSILYLLDLFIVFLAFFILPTWAVDSFSFLTTAIFFR
jgi:hypothetical protein